MKKWRYLLIAGLLVFGLACGLIDKAKDLIPDEDDAAGLIQGLVDELEDDSAAEDTPDDGDISTPDADVDEDVASDNGGDESGSDEVLQLDTDALDQLDSYRLRLYWQMNHADGTEEIMDLEVSATRDPKAYSYVMESDGEEIEIIQIDNEMWMRVGDEWVASTAEDMGAEDFSGFLVTPDDLDVSNWSDDDYKYLGKETVNGIRTRHYEAVYNSYWGALFAEEAMDEVEDATAEFWVANENDLPKFVVKMMVSIEGKVDDEQASWTMTQEIYDINESFSIEPPEGVTAGLPEGVPEYPGATDFASFGGMSTFMTEDSTDDVAEFYRGALKNAGWNEDDFSEMGGMITVSFSKDEQSLSLMITSDDSGTSVMFMTE